MYNAKSGPNGSLLVSRRTLPFPASYRFIPSHCIGDCLWDYLQVAAANPHFTNGYRGHIVKRNSTNLFVILVGGAVGGRLTPVGFTYPPSCETESGHE
jgi:hypothetical protein